MQKVHHSVRGRMRRHTHEANVILTIAGHELLFISLAFMVQNDYYYYYYYGFRGCMMNILTRLWIHTCKHHKSLTTIAQDAAKIDELPKWLYSWQVLTCFLRGSSVCIHVCTDTYMYYGIDRVFIPSSMWEAMHVLLIYCMSFFSGQGVAVRWVPVLIRRTHWVSVGIHPDVPCSRWVQLHLSECVCVRAWTSNEGVPIALYNSCREQEVTESIHAHLEVLPTLPWLPDNSH